MQFKMKSFCTSLRVHHNAVKKVFELKSSELTQLLTEQVGTSGARLVKKAVSNSEEAVRIDTDPLSLIKRYQALIEPLKFGLDSPDPEQLRAIRESTELPKTYSEFKQKLAVKHRGFLGKFRKGVKRKVKDSHKYYDLIKEHIVRAFEQDTTKDVDINFVKSTILSSLGITDSEVSKYKVGPRATFHKELTALCRTFNENPVKSLQDWVVEKVPEKPFHEQVEGFISKMDHLVDLGLLSKTEYDKMIKDRLSVSKMNALAIIKKLSESPSEIQFKLNKHNQIDFSSYVAVDVAGGVSVSEVSRKRNEPYRSKKMRMGGFQLNVVESL